MALGEFDGGRGEEFEERMGRAETNCWETRVLRGVRKADGGRDDGRDEGRDDESGVLEDEIGSLERKG